MTTVRLAHAMTGPGTAVLRGIRGHAKLPVSSRPAILVSFVYLEQFRKSQADHVYRDRVLDCGAYSARAAGYEIDLRAYIGACKGLMGDPAGPAEIFGLDVIGDWKATLRNVRKMWKSGVPAIPTYHLGEPEDVLRGIAKDYPKIALGGMADLRGPEKRRFVEQCFARVWPKPIHGFACGTEETVLAAPWHSVDASNWTIGPFKYGRWIGYGRLGQRGRWCYGRLSRTPSYVNVRVEIEYFLRLERQARSRWARELASLPPVQHLRRANAGGVP